MKEELGSPFGVDDVVPDVRTVEDYVHRLDPRRYRVKGMFVEPLRQRLGADFDALRPFLYDPPRGRYVPFRDYPQHDHTRCLAVLCDRLHPRLSHAEAMRRLARADFHTFRESTFGKVLLTMVGDARSAIARLPTVYEKVAPADQRVTVENLADGRVRVDITPSFSGYSYTLGQLEEVVVHFGGAPRIEVWTGPDDAVRYVVELG